MGRKVYLLFFFVVRDRLLFKRPTCPVGPFAYCHSSIGSSWRLPTASMMENQSLLALIPPAPGRPGPEAVVQSPGQRGREVQVTGEAELCCPADRASVRVRVGSSKGSVHEATIGVQRRLEYILQSIRWTNATNLTLDQCEQKLRLTFPQTSLRSFLIRFCQRTDSRCLRSLMLLCSRILHSDRVNFVDNIYLNCKNRSPTSSYGGPEWTNIRSDAFTCLPHILFKWLKKSLFIWSSSNGV